MTKSSLLRSDSERKFTPPTEFPAEYVDGNGRKVVILGRAPVEAYPLIGYTLHAEGRLAEPDCWEGGSAEPDCWTEKGSMFTIEDASESDLHDLPKRITTWHNVYDNWVSSQCSSRSDADDIDNVLRDALVSVRLCVHRIERDEDGGNPEIFVEEV
jgi:hypothetical protein